VAARPTPRRHGPRPSCSSACSTPSAAAAAAGGAPWTAADFTEQAAAYYAANGFDASAPALTDAQLAAIRARMAKLFARWDAVAPGGVLELRFDPDG
jgi:hypothetical protein